MNDEIEHFRNTPPTLENILIYIREHLSPLPKECELVALRLEEMPTLWAESQKEEDWKMKLTRSYEFAASHRLFSPRLSDEENGELYGKCANPAGHGHNYVLSVTVSGSADPRTGMLVDLDQLDKRVNELVVDRYDHKHLNVDVPEFKDRMTTSEIVAQQIWDALDGRLPATLEKVTLQETPRNVFEVER